MNVFEMAFNRLPLLVQALTLPNGVREGVPGLGNEGNHRLQRVHDAFSCSRTTHLRSIYMATMLSWWHDCCAWRNATPLYKYLCCR